jgi:hypothetical protein
LDFIVSNKQHGLALTLGLFAGMVIANENVNEENRTAFSDIMFMEW